jgi:hypothetical protein
VERRGDLEMIKKVIGGLLILLLLSGLVACAGENTGTTSQSPTVNPTPTPGPEPGINFNRTTDVIVSQGEKAEIILSLTNQSSKELKIDPFPPQIQIVKLPDVKPPYSVVRTFSAGNEELLLQPGESAMRSFTWDQKNDSGEQVPPGWYGVEVTTSTSSGSVQSVLVLPPEGVMGKAIEVNQSQTVNGITFKLERVVLAQKGMNIYAFNTPPDYSLPQGTQLPPPQFMSLHAEAEYSIDGGVIKQTYPSSIDFLDSGMRHTWYQYLDPVPQNSHKLTFRITRLGDWEGPWEFEVSLESGLPFDAGIGIANNQERFNSGDTVMYGIGITNLSSDKLTIDPYPPAMWIKQVEQDKVVYSEPAGDRTQDISAEDPQRLYRTKGVWDQMDNNGLQVDPGCYEMGYEYEINEQVTGKKYTLNLTTRFEIVEPDSAINKSLEVNQSLTAGELTVTLERIELNAANVKAYIFFIPPGYTPPGDRPPEQLAESLLNLIAEYSIDGGVVRTTLNSEAEFNQSGARLIWRLDPIPVGSQELTLTINQLGDWKGPWVFKVKLN